MKTLFAILALCTMTAHARIMDGGFWPAPRSSGTNAPAPDIGTPYAYWPMTASGTNTTQILGFANGVNLSMFPNVATGPALIGTNGYYYSLDGSDDKFIDLTNDTAFGICRKGLESPFTLSLWIYPTDTNRYIAGVDEGATGNRQWYSYIDASRYVYIVVMANNNVSLRKGIYTPAIPASSWTHLTIQYAGNKEESGLTIWTNGAAASASSFSLGVYSFATNTTANFTIGGQDSGAAEYAGLIDEVRWYTNILTGTQRTNLFTNGRTAGDSLPNP